MRIPEGGVRLSELLGTATVDGGGSVLGEVHDLHLREEATDAGSTHVSSSTGSLWAPGGEPLPHPADRHRGGR